MLKKNHNSKNTFGVIGLGRFGSALVKTLSESGKEVIAIDSVEAKVKAVRCCTENAFVVANLDKEGLQEVGIQNCDTVIVCIGEKIDTSILTTLHVVSLGVKRVIAKANSYEQGAVLEKIGAEVVYPEHDMAVRLANRLISPNIMEWVALKNDVNISEFKVPTRYHGKNIQEIDLRKNFGLNIIAIETEGHTTTDVDPQHILVQNDSIVVIGKAENISRFERYIIADSRI